MRVHIYKLQWNLHVRPSRTRDMLFKLLKLVFLLKALLKTGPPSLGILYRLHIYRTQWNLHVRPSRIRDMLVKLIKLVFLLKEKARPPNPGILYRSRTCIYRLQWNLHVRPSGIRDMLFLLKALLKTGPPNLCFLGGYLKQVLYRHITYSRASILYNEITFSLQLWWPVWSSDKVAKLLLLCSRKDWL